MNHLQKITTISNWEDILEKLEYCRKHSSKETYEKVLSSFKRTVLSIVLICIIYAIVLISGTDFNIYLDENHNVIDIRLVNNAARTASDKMVYWLLGSLIGVVLLFIIYILWLSNSKSSLNPGKEWNKYGKWLETKEENENWYYG